MSTRLLLTASLVLGMASNAAADTEPSAEPVAEATGELPAEPTAEPATKEATAAPKRVVIQPGQNIGGFSLDVLARKGITWDVTVTGGLRLTQSDGGDSKVWMGRLRAGIMLYKEPSFLIVGPSVQFGGIAAGAAIGGELEAIHLARGMWGQVGAYGDRDGAILGLSAGYTLFGLEYQRRLSGDRERDYSILFNLHIPIGVIRVSLQPIPVRATQVAN